MRRFWSQTHSRSGWTFLMNAFLLGCFVPSDFGKGVVGQEIIQVNGAFDNVYLVVVNNSVQNIFAFNHTVSRDKMEGVRVHVNVLSEQAKNPVLFVIRQQKAVVSFQAPLMLRGLYQRKYIYPDVSRTLCQPEVKSELKMQYFYVDVSTLSEKNASVQLYVKRIQHFALRTGEQFRFNATPSQPQYFRYKFSDAEESVIVKVTSDSVFPCSVASIQDVCFCLALVLRCNHTCLISIARRLRLCGMVFPCCLAAQTTSSEALHTNQTQWAKILNATTKCFCIEQPKTFCNNTWKSQISADASPVFTKLSSLGGTTFAFYYLLSGGIHLQSACTSVRHGISLSLANALALISTEENDQQAQDLLSSVMIIKHFLFLSQQRKDFRNSSFYVVVVVKTEDEACGGALPFYPLKEDNGDFTVFSLIGLPPRADCALNDFEGQLPSLVECYCCMAENSF
ncbi:SID1 transmembrane family member 2-like [Narcine bancroftii]|uniref:SID1 transmembrane family member 2-like n=1 Tax=Narcine bancroftii TaxID=1343680 RepID=UPI0038316C04